MPKSKRNKQISLTRTEKTGMVLKKRLIKEVQSCVDNYANIFVYSVNDMRNSKLKQVREQWKHSRFFFGKNNVMALALGRTPSDEYRPNLHQVSNKLKGQCGLLFSNQPKEEVLNWFDSFSDFDFSRSGNTAQYAVELSEGPLPQFPHSLEPYLRQLGMPTTLQKGIVHLIKDFEVCKEGDTLTPETAKILKLLGHQMAEFRIGIECCWTNEGAFHEIGKSSNNKTEMKEENLKMDIDVKEEELNPKPQSALNGVTPCRTSKPAMDESENKTPDDELKSMNDILLVEEKLIGNDDDADQGSEVADDESHDEQDKESHDDAESLNEEDISKGILTSDKFIDAKSSPDEKSPLYRSLRNRTVKVIRKKKAKP